MFRGILIFTGPFITVVYYQHRRGTEGEMEYSTTRKQEPNFPIGQSSLADDFSYNSASLLEKSS